MFSTCRVLLNNRLYYIDVIYKKRKNVTLIIINLIVFIVKDIKTLVKLIVFGVF